MTPDRSSRVDLLERADRLAAEDRWEELRRTLAERHRDEIVAASRLAYRYGEALYHTGRFDELEAFSGAWEEEARTAADPEGIMGALNLAYIAAFETGRIEEARQRCERLMEMAEATGDRSMLARAANNLGILENLSGHTEDAIRHYRLALPLYERLGDRRRMAQIHHNLGISYRDMGWLYDAAEEHREAGSIADGLGYAPLAAMAAVGRAEVALRGDDAELAAKFAEQGLETAREAGDPVTEADARRVLAVARAAAGGPDARDARELLETAVRVASERDSRLVEAEARRDLAGLLADGGEAGRAREELRRARDLFDALGAERQRRDVARRLNALG